MFNTSNPFVIPDEVYEPILNSPLGRTPIYVPDGVAVLSLQADDMLKTCHGVLYKECVKRGIPITLCLPAVMGGIDHISYDLCTDKQVAQMIGYGGAGLIYHSVSHYNWHDGDIAWFKREIAEGCDYGGKPCVVDYRANIGISEIAVGQTLEDRIGAAIQANGFFETDSTGALCFHASGFTPPGQWTSSTDGLNKYGYESVYWQELRKRWPAVFAHGGMIFQNGPNRGYNNRLTYQPHSTALNTAWIEQMCMEGSVCHAYAHEWLYSGETGTYGEGSAKTEDDLPYEGTSFVLYATLTSLLDKIKTEIDAGRLIVMTGSAAANIIRGPRSRSNMLENPDLRADWYGNTTAYPAGWARITESGENGCCVFTQDSSALGYNALRITNAVDSANLPSWYTIVETDGSCEQFLFCCRINVAQRTGTPNSHRARITIYGSEINDPLVVDGVEYWRATDFISGQTFTTGLLAQPLYVYNLDGVENGDLGACQNVADDGFWHYVQIPFSLPYPLRRIAIRLQAIDDFPGGEDGAAASINFANLALYPNGV